MQYPMGRETVRGRRTYFVSLGVLFGGASYQLELACVGRLDRGNNGRRV